MAPGDGLHALAQAMQREAPNGLFSRAQLAVFDADWTHVGAGVDTQLDTPLFRQLAVDANLAPAIHHQRIASSGSALPEMAQAETLRERLRAVAPNRRSAALLDEVRTLTQKVLGIAPDAEFDVQEPLRQLGLDSLMAVELRNRLGRASGTMLPATVTFDFPTVQALAHHLAATVLADEFAAADSPRAADLPRTVDDAMNDNRFDDLSDAELAMRLTSRLDALQTGDSR